MKFIILYYNKINKYLFIYELIIFPYYFGSFKVISLG
jgi:hypothetical protein